MKKKSFLLAALTAVCAAVCAFLFAACADADVPPETDVPPEHVHTYSTEWSSDGQNHWHASTCGHDVKSDNAAHTGDPCTVCGYDSKIDGFEFQLNDEGASYSVVGISDVTATEIVIPSEYQGKPVTSIGYQAFINCSKLTSVTIGNGVTSIGEDAFFNCSGLTSVTIPDSVTDISYRAFSGCSGLTSITYTGDIKSWCSISGLRYLMYYGTSNKTLTIGGKEVTGELIIPNDVTSIAEYAFYNCSKLASITIHDSVTNIGGSAFSGCPIESATIPSIAISCISQSVLKTVEITSGTSIGYSAFLGCSGLTNITIPDSVTNMREHAFGGCDSLTSITYSGNIKGWCSISGLHYLMDYGISSKTLTIGGKEIKGELIIPNDVTSIPSCAFRGCSELTSVTIPNSVTSIGEDAFFNCSGLTSVTIPDSVTSIGSGAFYGCDGLTSVTIPNSVTSIGYSAFSGCSGLTSVTIPNSVTSIGDRAFWGCDGLTSITIPDSVTSIGRNAFYNCDSLQYNEFDNAYYLGNTDNPYLVLVKVKSRNISSCTINTNTKIIVANPFTSCRSLQYNEFDNAYYLGNTDNPYLVLVKAKSKDISSCTINADTIIICSGAFSGYSGLTSITIPDSVTSIGSGAFCECDGLTSVTIPDSVTSIGDSAFSECDGLTSVTIPDSVTSIGYGVFGLCRGLTSVTIGNSVTSIGERAFQSCWGLTSITFGGTIAQWEAISKGNYWDNETGNYTVHCTDGDIAKSQS